MVKRYTPRTAILAECKSCMNGQNLECLSDLCYLNPLKYHGMSHMERIKYHCGGAKAGGRKDIGCCAPDGDVNECEVEDCPLFPYRFGVNPRRSEAAKKRDFSHLKETQFQTVTER